MFKINLLLEGVLILTVLAISAFVFYTAGVRSVTDQITNQTEATINCDSDNSQFLNLELVSKKPGTLFIKCIQPNK